MGEIVKAKLFTHGGSQAVRLPKAFRFEGAEVRIRKDGERVILEPLRDDPATRDWAAFWARIDAHKTGGPEDDWPEIERPPADEPDLDW
jgi:antitoxin VapB